MKHQQNPRKKGQQQQSWEQKRTKWNEHVVEFQNTMPPEAQSKPERPGYDTDMPNKTIEVAALL